MCPSCLAIGLRRRGIGWLKRNSRFRPLTPSSCTKASFVSKLNLVDRRGRIAMLFPTASHPRWSVHSHDTHESVAR